MKEKQQGDFATVWKNFPRNPWSKQFNHYMWHSLYYHGLFHCDRTFRECIQRGRGDHLAEEHLKIAKYEQDTSRKDSFIISGPISIAFPFKTAYFKIGLIWSNQCYKFATVAETVSV